MDVGAGKRVSGSVPGATFAVMVTVVLKAATELSAITIIRLHIRNGWLYVVLQLSCGSAAAGVHFREEYQQAVL